MEEHMSTNSQNTSQKSKRMDAPYQIMKHTAKPE